MPAFEPLLITSPAFVHHQARRRGAAGGIVFGDDRLTYGALAATIDELAAWLARRGLGSGDAVGIMAANEPAMIAMLYAVWGLGAVVVPVSVRATAEETARQLEHARARALVCDTKRVDVARDAGAAAGLPVFACAPAPPLAPAIVRRPRHRLRGRAGGVRSEGLAAIAYTSGSSGSPKGVMLSHRNVFWATLACSQARGDRPESVGACMSALSHVPVLVSHLLCRIFLGATAVLLERFDVDSVLASVERWGVTDLPLIGGMVFDVVARSDVPAAVRRSVRKVSVGGAPTPMESKRRLAAIFDGAEVIEAYGQTESTDGVLMARGTSVFDREGTVGTMNPHVHVAILRPDGSAAAPDEEGAICIAGPTVMGGYFRNAQATRAALREGWLHTGDLGRAGADGYFFLTGRVKDLIITGGENVTPLEVEEVLRLHPDVADVAVIGTPHPKWGEQVTAIVVRRDGALVDGDALADFAGERLAGFKKPRRIEFVASLPRNAYNKVQTHLLKQEFGRPMSYETILFDVDPDGVATLTLNRPEKRNAWDRQMGLEIRRALRDADARDEVRVVVVTGAGKDFCVGADLGGAGRVFEEVREGEAAGAERLSLKAWDIRKPIIGALNGAVAGVGATLPLHWDIRLAGESTRITFVFVKRGLTPEAASTWVLPRIVGVSRASELLLTGRLVRAAEALEIGLVSRVVPDAELLPAAQALAREIARETAPVAVALTKQMIWRFLSEPDPSAAERLDGLVFGWTTQSPDAKEGMRSFLDKRPPRWGMRVSTDVPELDGFLEKK